MDKIFGNPGDYLIEISGWGLDNGFFAERTELQWTLEGEKQVCLRRALPEGAVVFVRLLASEPTSGTVPVAYRIQQVMPMDCTGRCAMRLAQLHPQFNESRTRESQRLSIASNLSEDAKRVCDVHEIQELQDEEVLR
jgi:hypothetical protein